jgi:hypothetical protein
VELKACDFEEVKGKPKPVYCNFAVRVRPQAIMSYHEFTQQRWDRLLEEL